jgi:hypothetical protein
MSLDKPPIGKSPIEKVLSFFEEDEIAFMNKVYYEVFDPYTSLPVLYAGSGGDLEHALILGRNLVFFESHLPQENISEITSKIDEIGKIRNLKKSGELGRGGKIIIDFDIAGVNFKLTYYAEDATTIGVKSYPELESGIYVYFVKVPFPKEERVGSLREPGFFGRILSKIEVGGFYFERECPLTFKISSSKLGFKKIASGYISALSIHKNAMGNLYKKIRRVDNLQELIHQDYQEM